jgi:hypothetical protein
MLPKPADAARQFETMPADAVRRLYALFLAEIALNFLFMHEYQHIAGGHLSFLTGARRDMSETNGPALADLMTSHVLELEADAAAANFSLNIALNRAWDDTIPPALLPSLATDKSRFQAWLFAVHTLFLLMEEATNRAFFAGRAPPATHPDSVFKRGTLAILVFARRGPFPKAADAFQAGMEMLMAAHEVLAGVAEGREQLMLGVDLFGEQDQDSIPLVAQRWQEMRPELQRLAALNGAHCAPDDLISVFLHGW